ncbi:hypothetical protein PG988_002287 [Apiospora saccharicola]
MADQGNNNSVGQPEWYDALVQELQKALDEAAELPMSLMDQLQRMPAEVFDGIVGNLTIPQQADLARSTPAMYRRVKPVMEGYVWSNAPLPLPEMMGDGESRLQLQWQYVKQAEADAKGTELVACPWCSIIHHPLHSLDSKTSMYWCTYQDHIRSDPVTSLFLRGMDNRPLKWHPLVVYAFGVWSQRGIDTTPLVDAAELNYSAEELDVSDSVPMTRNQWKLKWVPDHGLFVRWRQPEMVTSPDDWKVDGED